MVQRLEYRSCNPGVGGLKISAYSVSLVAVGRTWFNCCFWPSCFSSLFFRVLSQLSRESNSQKSGDIKSIDVGATASVDVVFQGFAV